MNEFLVDLLAAQVRRLSVQVLESMHSDAETPVYRRLHAVAHSYSSAGDALVVPLAQDDVATMAWTTRPTANAALRAAEAMGLVELSRGRTPLPT